MQFEDNFDKTCTFVKDHLKARGWDIEWVQTTIDREIKPGVMEVIYQLQSNVLLHVWGQYNGNCAIVTIQFPDTSIDTSIAFTAMSDDEKSRALNNIVEVFGKWRNVRKRQR